MYSPALLLASALLLIAPAASAGLADVTATVHADYGNRVVLTGVYVLVDDDGNAEVWIENNFCEGLQRTPDESCPYGDPDGQLFPPGEAPEPPSP